MVTKTEARRATTPAPIPLTMRAAAIDAFGPPEVLTLRTLPVPKPGPHEVLIEVHAAGVGGWDAWMRSDPAAIPRPRFPLVLGTDGAGLVAAKGSSAKGFALGDPVWAYEFLNPKGGFYAEYVAIHVNHVGRIADHLDLLEAGAGAVTGLTALQGIDDRLKVKSGQHVLVFGASGAVGTLAVQFAKLRGARVVGTATGREAQALVRQLGADEVVDARKDDVVDRLRAFAPQGLDAALALAGGEALERCLDLLRPGSRLAYPNGVEPIPRPRPGVHATAYDAVAEPPELAKFKRAAEQAHLRVPIAAVYPLEQAAAAHAAVERGHVHGRIVLEIRPV